jgi:adenosylcobinamide kinase/adenosylcobinamide-phosphate guanylyltransferase
MFTFVTGGLRSGKSEYGLRRASELGPPPWLYVAPHIEGDDELKARLARHRRDQEAAWRLLEAPSKLAATLQGETLAGHGAAVIDRLTIWLSNRLNASEATADYDLVAEVEALSDKLYRSTTPFVVITTEIGLGFLPAAVPDRRLINVAGIANQILAERAQSVVMMVSGVPLRLR